MAAVELTRSGRPCVVVLGASNVSRGLTRLTGQLAVRTDGADLFVAAGHGRSYGANSRVWMRRLPSILWCGLWRALDREGVVAGDRGPTPARPVLALVTDVGNDLLYGFAVEQVASWVRESVRRLADRGALTVVTRLPLATIDRVGPLRYQALRTFFVPGCRRSLEEIKDAAAELDERLVGIAAEVGATVIEQPGDWYGIDALHVRRRHLDTLWAGVCDAWGLSASGRPHRPPSVARWMAVGTKGAEVRSLAGVMRFTPQPVLTGGNGPRLWLY